MATTEAVLEQWTEPAPAQEFHIRPGELEPWPGLNPRRRFDPEKHAQLVESFKKQGVLVPLLVHNTPAEGRYWIVAGERRWRAAQEAGLQTVPCRVREFTLAEAVEIALIENLDRDDLTVIEEARGLQAMLEANPKLSQAKLADRLGRSQPWIANRLRLLELPDVALALIEEELIHPTAARDHLLPFAKITIEAKRTTFFDSVASEIRKLARQDKEPPDDRQVVHVVIEAAARLSRRLGDSGRVWNVDRDSAEPEFDARLHAACKCGGPRYRYAYGSASVRCFDDAWWNGQQKAAIEKRKAAEKAAQERLAKKNGKAPAPTRMTREQFRAKHGYVNTAIAAAGGYGDRDPVDASLLADAPLVVLVTDNYGGPEVYVTDKKLYNRAKAAATKEKNRILQERRAARTTKDLEQAARTELEPWMLAEIIVSRPQRDDVLEVGRDLGYDGGKHGQMDDHIRKLPADQVTTLLKVLAIRCKRGDLGWRDPLVKEVESEVRKKYAPGVGALVKRARAAVGVGNGKGGAKKKAKARA